MSGITATKATNTAEPAEQTKKTAPAQTWQETGLTKYHNDYVRRAADLGCCLVTHLLITEKSSWLAIVGKVALFAIASVGFAMKDVICWAWAKVCCGEVTPIASDKDSKKAGGDKGASKAEGDKAKPAKKDKTTEDSETESSAKKEKTDDAEKSKLSLKETNFDPEDLEAFNESVNKNFATLSAAISDLQQKLGSCPSAEQVQHALNYIAQGSNVQREEIQAHLVRQRNGLAATQEAVQDALDGVSQLGKQMASVQKVAHAVRARFAPEAADVDEGSQADVEEQSDVENEEVQPQVLKQTKKQSAVGKGGAKLEETNTPKDKGPSAKHAKKEAPAEKGRAKSKGDAPKEEASGKPTHKGSTAAKGQGAPSASQPSSSSSGQRPPQQQQLPQFQTLGSSPSLAQMWSGQQGFMPPMTQFPMWNSQIPFDPSLSFSAPGSISRSQQIANENEMAYQSLCNEIRGLHWKLFRTDQEPQELIPTFGMNFSTKNIELAGLRERLTSKLVKEYIKCLKYTELDGITAFLDSVAKIQNTTEQLSSLETEIARRAALLRKALVDQIQDACATLKRDAQEELQKLSNSKTNVEGIISLFRKSQQLDAKVEELHSDSAEEGEEDPEVNAADGAANEGKKEK